MINRYDHRGNRLSKFDAPLRLQYERGIKSFRKGKVKSPYPLNTMLHREWQRGFDFAYFVNLKRTKKYEARTRGKRDSFITKTIRKATKNKERNRRKIC